MEDLDALWDTPISQDLIELLESGFSDETIKDSLKAMFGDNWKKEGSKILKADAPDLLEKFDAIE